MRLIAENIGPFERLNIDFSDGQGKPHLGPHILAGVNGSGKSTLLRAIAWALSSDLSGFPEEEWRHFLRGPESRVFVHVSFGNDAPYINAATADNADGWDERLEDWVREIGVASEIGLLHSLGLRSDATVSRHSGVLNQPPIAAYAPVRALSYLDSPAKMQSLRRPTEDCLGFESTVQNRAIQRWLVDLFSRRALAKERGQEFDSYQQTLTQFQDALKLVCDDPNIRVDVELGPILEPRLNFHGKKLNFSQLSDGVRTTIGWLADFMMRQDQNNASNVAKSSENGILLLDEIDIYLHPRWQRTLLPAMRKAMPHVQVIASSHSPFVISSCRDARIHVLTLDERGAAHKKRGTKADCQDPEDLAGGCFEFIDRPSCAKTTSRSLPEGRWDPHTPKRQAGLMVRTRRRPASPGALKLGKRAWTARWKKIVAASTGGDWATQKAKKALKGPLL